MLKQQGLRGKALQWWVDAQEQVAPVQVAEQFQHWSVRDESGLDGLLVGLGREQWERFQDVVESFLRERVLG